MESNIVLRDANGVDRCSYINVHTEKFFGPSVRIDFVSS